MAQVLIIGDTRDHVSRTQGGHYKDGNGRLFWHLLYSSGFKGMDLNFVYADELPLPIFSSYDIVISLGQEALESVVGLGSPVERFRGSVLPLPGSFLVPTLHPRTLKKPFEMFRESPIERMHLVALDLIKARMIIENGFTNPIQNFTLVPDINLLKDFVEESKDAPFLGVDLEADGLNTDYAPIYTIGFATSRERAFVVPIRDSGGRDYWTSDVYPQVRACLDELLLNRKLIFQNGYGYDILLLRREGWEIPWDNYVADTMLMHHALDPELPHNIGFISSVWGHQPYWKESFLSKGVHIGDTDQIEMRRYNAQDCTALIDIHATLNAELDRLGLQETNKREHDLIPSIVTMFERGLGHDKSKEVAWQKWLKQELTSTESTLRRDFSLPENFNFGSNDHMSWLLYAKKTPGMVKKEKALLEYDEEYEESVQFVCRSCGQFKRIKFEVGTAPASTEQKCSTCRQRMPFFRTLEVPEPCSPKSRHTKRYRDIRDTVSILEVEPLRRPKNFRPSRTTTGRLGTNKDALTRFSLAVQKRQATLDGQTRPNQVERDGLLRSSDFLGRYQDQVSFAKLDAAFHDLPLGIDGNIHPKILIQGTATGRFSCKNPNAMQMPNAKSMAGSKVRDIFMASDQEASLLSVDYSNLEVVCGAYFMEDTVLQQTVEMGLNVHDENTKIFFGVDNRDPRWPVLRDVSKIIQFGRLFYGGSDNGIYNRIRIKVPDAGLTRVEFKDAVAKYMDRHPAYIEYMDAVQTRARDKRTSVNGYGRLRNFYGPGYKIGRQALNNPIQGTAADFVTNAILRLWERGLGHIYRSYVALQIHDELLFVIYPEEKEEVYAIIQAEMLRPQTIKTYKGTEVTFSVLIDSEEGSHWGSLVPVDLSTGNLLEGESKH